ncbi:MAG: hypothetical protein QOE61_4109 [Micromonosporaceae bacterium]|nr:hypothetical protein [Micromonosporaceae bacterium]
MPIAASTASPQANVVDRAVAETFPLGVSGCAPVFLFSKGTRCRRSPSSRYRQPAPIRADPARKPSKIRSRPVFGDDLVGHLLDRIREPPEAP